MATAVTKRSFNIQTDDTYTLNTCVPDSDRKQTVLLTVQRNGAYDGTFLVKARTRGSPSTINYQTIAYKLMGTGATQASALGAADCVIQIDATGLELALVSTGRTTGSLDCYVDDAPEQ